MAVTIDASALASFNFDTFISDYFAALTNGDYAFYGGEPDSAFGGTYYMNGSQILYIYEDAAANPVAASVLFEGEEMAYDFIHHGPALGHGISGELDEIVFGNWIDGTTTGTQGTGASGEVSGFEAMLTISGLDIVVEPGTGPGNTLGNLYSAAQDGDASVFNEFLAGFALEFQGGDGDDDFRGGDLDDVINGGGGADFLRGRGGRDHIDGGDGDDEIRGKMKRDVLLGGDGDDEIFGGKAKDRIDGGDGDDRLKGGLGPDVFNFLLGGGDDVVVDFDPARDRARFAEGDLANFRELSAAASQDGADLLIDLGGGDSVTFLNLSLADVDHTDFGFV